MTREIPNTQAYLRWREQTQATFDFCVLVSHAVPTLKRQMTLIDNGIIPHLPKPDYYPKTSSNESLRAQAQIYKKQLASYLVISLFSYFEAYVIDAIQEMFEFHGGLKQFQERAAQRDKMFMKSVSAEVYEKKRKLRGKRNKMKISQYRSNSKKLASMGYRFPSELLSGYGIKMLSQKVANLKSNEIPDLLTHGLHLKLDEATINQYHEFRNLRNSIAHGRKVDLSIKEVGERNEILRNMAYALDLHLNEHFMIFEDYL
ncbi:MAG: HEPN domain-containing protein [Anaerolineales bacterium]